MRSPLFLLHCSIADLREAHHRADLAATAGSALTETGDASELPEPEVFAMMLLRRIRIGYRASRHRDEKFE